jgi:hypothetical protein
MSATAGERRRNKPHRSPDFGLENDLEPSICETSSRPGVRELRAVAELIVVAAFPWDD